MGGFLQEYSVLRLSKELTQEHPDAWDESSIETRGKLLTKRICEVWPGPPPKSKGGTATSTEVQTTEPEIADAVGALPNNLTPEGAP